MPTFKDVDYPVGDDNFGGTGDMFYFCPRADIATLPAVPGTITNPEDKVTLAGTLTCKTGKKFYKMYITPETGGLKSVPTGVRDGKGYRNTYTGSTPGSDPALLGILSSLINTPIIAFITELSNGQTRMMGDSLMAATIMDESDSGDKLDSGNLSKITIESSGRRAPILPDTIAIPLTPAT